jgi:hypothetical protein
MKGESNLVRLQTGRRVSPAPPPSPLKGAAEMLGFIVPALKDAERTVARLRHMMDRERLRLAEERGVAFIREEQIRKEFGEEEAN